MTPYLTTSASPLRYSRAGSVFQRRRRVDPDADRLVEGADHVLGPRQIHRDLAADGAVDHRQQRRRDHEERQAAGVGRSDEACEIADDAAADRDDQRPPIGRQIEERLVQLSRHGERFLSLAGRPKRDARAEADGAERIVDIASPVGDVLVRDDESGGRLALGARERTDAGRVVAREDDVVAARSEIDAEAHGADAGRLRDRR